VRALTAEAFTGRPLRRDGFLTWGGFGWGIERMLTASELVLYGWIQTDKIREQR